jgi:hypothetical protein
MIKLTRIDGSPVWINLSHIVYMYVNKSTFKTTVVLSSQIGFRYTDFAIEVQDTPESIAWIELLKSV